MLGAGAAHLVVPQLYDGLIPSFLGPPRPWVIASGVAELAVGAMLVVPRTRRAGALCTAALLVAVFPGNITSAVRAGAPWRSESPGRAAIPWLRLPLQVPLVLWALHHARTPGAAETAGRLRAR